MDAYPTSGVKRTRSFALPCLGRAVLGPLTAELTQLFTMARGKTHGLQLRRRLFQRHRTTVRIGRFHALLAPLRGAFQRSLTVLVCYRLPHFHI